MTFRILQATGADAALWQSWVDRLPYESRSVLLTPAYARVQGMIGRGEPICLQHDSGDLLPSLFDGEWLTSLYGGVNTWRDLDMEWRRKLGVTSEYRQTVGWAGSGEKVKDAVIVDLNYRAELLDGFSRNRRREIEADAKDIAAFTVAPDKRQLDHFHSLYRGNMQRLNADKEWWLPERIWGAYARELWPEHMSLLTCGEAMLLVLHGYGKAYAHYIAGEKHHALLYYEAMRHCSDVGCETFFLGGGTTTSPDDPLLAYKLGFSKRTVPVYVYKATYDDKRTYQTDQLPRAVARQC